MYTYNKYQGIFVNVYERILVVLKECLTGFKVFGGGILLDIFGRVHVCAVLLYMSPKMPLYLDTNICKAILNENM